MARAALLSSQSVPAEWKELSPAEQIRRLRLRFGLNQRELAQAAGVPASLVCRAESGADVRLSTLRRLFAAVDCVAVILPAGGLSRLDALDRRLEEEWKASGLYRVMQQRGWSKED